jgi:ribose transport system substrate-binding protein
MRKVRLLPALLGVTGLVLAAGCASTSSTPSQSATSSAASQSASSQSAPPQGAGSVPSVTEFCPDKPTKVAFENVLTNDWSKIVMAEIKSETSQCKNITEVTFSGGGTDQEDAISDLNSLVAQRYNLIILNAEYGAPELPAIKAATAAGVKVVEFVGDAGGTPGKDYVAFVDGSSSYVAQQWAQWLNKTVHSGEVVFLGGTPGAASSTVYYDDLKQALAQYPALKLYSKIVYTNYDSGQAEQAMTGLLAQQGRIPAVVTDYGVEAVGAVQAYQAAGLALPAVETTASSNSNGCAWDKAKFPFFSVDGNLEIVQVAVRKGLAALKGVQDPEPSLATLHVSIDTTAGQNPLCVSSLPADTDMYEGFTPAQLKTILG